MSHFLASLSPRHYSPPTGQENCDCPLCIDSRKCITRLPEEPSCPACERTREIISSRINAAQCNQKWEVLDALKEVQEAISK